MHVYELYRLVVQRTRLGKRSQQVTDSEDAWSQFGLGFFSVARGEAALVPARADQIGGHH